MKDELSTYQRKKRKEENTRVTKSAAMMGQAETKRQIKIQMT